MNKKTKLSGERRDFILNYILYYTIRTMEHLYTKVSLDLALTHYAITVSKWTMNLNVRYQIIKLLERILCPYNTKSKSWEKKTGRLVVLKF